MKLDTGMIVVIGAVLVFYLRLIVIQRQRTKQIQRERSAAGAKKSKNQVQVPRQSYSILSSNPRNLAIGGAGALGILAGVLLFAGILPFPAIQPFWWIPVALGIVAFSWTFEL